MATITKNRGTDITGTLFYHDGGSPRQPINLTGYTFTTFDASTDFDFNNQITFTPNDLVNGLVNFRIEWTDSIPINTTKELSFRCQATNGNDDVGTPKIIVVYT